MSKKKVIEVDGGEVVIIQQDSSEYISLTDMAKHKMQKQRVLLSPIGLVLATP